MARRERSEKPYVIDYINVHGSTTNPVTFRSNQTYYISSPLVMDGPGAVVTLEPGAIIKIATNASITLQNDSWVRSKAHLACPAILTTACDTNVGEAIPGVTGDPEAQRVGELWVFDGGTGRLEGVDMRYAEVGVRFNTPGDDPVEFRHSILRSMNRGVDVRAGAGGLTLKNILFEQVHEGVLIATNQVGIYHCVFDQLSSFAIGTNTGSGVVSLTNNVFVSVTNEILRGSVTNGYEVGISAMYLSATQNWHWAVVTATNHPFISGPHGDHYLPSDSPWVDAGSGTANHLGLEFHTAITNPYISEGHTIVDLGFHYPSIADTDGDGLLNVIEIEHAFVSIYFADFDGDGLDDGLEYWTHDTDFTNPDSDGDGIGDGDEILTYGTSALSDDTDRDGLDDAWEITYGFDPLHGGMNHLAAWWALNETSGTIANDGSTNSNSGTLQQFTGTPWTTGLFDQALDLDGTNDHVQVTDHASLKPSQVAVSAWIQPYRDLTNNSAIMFSKEQPGSAGGYVLRYMNGSIDFMIGSTAYQYNELRRATNLLANTWYHLLGTYDGTNHSLYLNGNLVAQSNKTFTIRHTTVHPRIGATADYTPINFFPGILDDVRVFHTGLSTAEVLAIYEHGMDGDGDGLTTREEYTHGTNPTLEDTDEDGLTDWEEVTLHQTDPLNPDTDQDGMPDGWEVQHALNPLVHDAADDEDSDFLSNLDEYTHGTDPQDYDTDDDLLADGKELTFYNTNPTKWDTVGGMGVSDAFQKLIADTGPGLDMRITSILPIGSCIQLTLSGTSPLGLYDFYVSDDLQSTWYVGESTVAANDITLIWLDCGGAGRPLPPPIRFYTASKADDTDGDGLGSGFEYFFLSTSPDMLNSDGVGAHDGEEDFDNDGLTNAEEYNSPDYSPYEPCRKGSSNPWLVDTDGDGYSDGPNVPPPYMIQSGPDAFPLDPSAWRDTDCDGKPNELLGPSNSEPPLEEDDDDDGDSMPDAWEAANGTDPLVDDADLDLDGDGASNLSEFGAGTAANDGSSFPYDAALEAALAQVNATQIAYLSYLTGLSSPTFDATANYATRISQYRSALEDLLPYFLDLDVNPNGILANEPEVTPWDLDAVLSYVDNTSGSWTPGHASVSQVSEVENVLDQLDYLYDNSLSLSGEPFTGAPWKPNPVAYGAPRDLGSAYPETWPPDSTVKTYLLFAQKQNIPESEPATVDDFFIINGTRYPSSGNLYHEYQADITASWSEESVNELQAWDCGNCAGDDNNTYLSDFEVVHVVQPPILSPRLVPDWNRDKKIDSSDENQATSENPYRYWINDDDDETAYTGNDIPVGGGDYGDDDIDSVRDLIDYFPVYIDLKDTLDILGTEDYSYHLQYGSGWLGFVYTELAPDHAGDYLTEHVIAESVAGETVNLILSPGNSRELDLEFLDAIQNGGEGVVLVEAGVESTDPLVLAILDSDDNVICSANLHLSVYGVEDFYRHINLRPDGDGRAMEVGEPPNYPDSLSPNGKNVFFLHGFMTDGEEARGWHAEVFKRLYWSGSNSRYWGVTWEGDIGWPDALFYQANVENALNIASNLVNEINSVSNKTVMAHSLGNMVVSAAIQDYGLSVDNYFMLNAAVAIEAYDQAEFNTSITGNHMVHENWPGYSTNTWSATWHQLFASPDDRAALTWKSRFPSVLANAYNFYSTGDEIFELVNGMPSVFSGLPFEKERYAWHKQEVFKGRYEIGSMDKAGWGFSGEYTQAEANAATPDNLRTNAVFRQEPVEMFSSNIEQQTQNEILGLGIPALSGAAGRDSLAPLPVARNYDMDANKPPGYPSRGAPYNTRWLHNDLKNMAYPYTHQLFDELITQGSLQ